MSSEPCHLETTILNQQNAINSMKSLCFMENMWYQIISTLISCHLSCKNVQTRLLQPMTWDSYTTSWLLFPFKTHKKLSPIIERAQKCIQIYSLNNFHLLTDGCGMVAVGQPVPGQVITQPSSHGQQQWPAVQCTSWIQQRCDQSRVSNNGCPVAAAAEKLE